MIATGASFTGTSLLVRYLSDDMHPIQITFLRSVFGLVVLAPWVWRYGFGGMRTDRYALHAFRAVCSTGGAMSWFSAVSLMPLAEATSLAFTTPLFTTLGAALFLRERVGPRRWTAVVVGFVGVLVVLRPGAAPFGLGAALALVSAVCNAGVLLTVKALTRTERWETIALYQSTQMVALSLVPALFVWQWPDLMQVGQNFGVALFATLAQFFMVASFRAADASAVMPFDYVRLLFAAAVGYALFGEVPDAWTWVGASIVFVATVYSARAERRRGHGA